MAWPLPGTQLTDNLLWPLGRLGTLRKLVLDQNLFCYDTLQLEAALFAPELGLEATFAEAAGFLPATLQTLHLRVLRRTERVMDAIGRHLVNLQELQLEILFNMNWADEFMLRGGRPIRSATMPVSDHFMEQFGSIVWDAELRRRDTPLLDPLRNLASLRDITLHLEMAYFHACDRVLETSAFRRFNQVMTDEIVVLGLYSDAAGNVLLENKLNDLDQTPEENAELWLDRLNQGLPPVKLGAAPPSLERLTIGDGGHTVWHTANGPLPRGHAGDFGAFGGHPF